MWMSMGWRGGGVVVRRYRGCLTSHSHSFHSSNPIRQVIPLFPFLRMGARDPKNSVACLRLYSSLKTSVNL